MRRSLTLTLAVALATLLLPSSQAESAPPRPAARPARAAKSQPGLRRGASAVKSRPQRTELPGRLLRTPAPEPPPVMAADEAPPPDPGDPDRARILRLQEALSSIVHGPVLGRLKVGMRVVEAGTGRTFFRQHASTMMDPASNQKVLATTAAIMRLGAGYRFRTELSGPPPDGDGVVHGDVVLRGSGDPSLGMRELTSLAGSLAARGVTRIEGGVMADPRRIGSGESNAEERSPLRVSRGSILIRIRPGANGSPPIVGVRPALDAIQIRNRAVTKGKVRGKLRVTVTGTDTRLIVEVQGRMAVNHPGMTMSRIPVNQRLFAASLLHAAMASAGITVKGTAAIGTGKFAADAGKPELLAIHRSLPLAILIRHINKDSNNEWSERLLDVVGAELYGGAATPDKGLRALREAMDDISLPRTSYIPTNGSGLGHSNRLTADAMADLLQKLYTDPRWGPELLQSLSVGGVDGTTRNRFRGSPAAERVRAKTGTLDGKSCLSGYVGDGEDVLVFAILVEGPKGRRFATHAVRAAQVGAVNAMMRYARGVLDAPTGEEVAPAEDFEVGDDVIEIDNEDAAPASGDPAKAAPLSPEPLSPRPLSLAPPPISFPLPPLERQGTRTASRENSNKPKSLRPASARSPNAGALRR